MEKFSCQAIVLDLRDYGEADLIVSLFSPKLGKLQAIAKSARKSKRRFVNKLETFTLLYAVLRPSRAGLPLLEEAELVNSFLRLRQHADLYATATLFREFLIAAVHEGDSDAEMFSLSLWALDSLDRANQGCKDLPCRAVAAQFLVRYFDRIGYRPELEHCQKCGKAMTAGAAWLFSAVRGGVVCPSCAADPATGQGQFGGPPGGQTVQPGTAKFLSSSQDAPLSHLHRLKITPAPLAEALHILWRYGNAVLGREIVSWRLFWQLTGTQSR